MISCCQFDINSHYLKVILGDAVKVDWYTAMFLHSQTASLL
ncbi:unnamed protein product [Rhodiola kirilowii]